MNNKNKTNKINNIISNDNNLNTNNKGRISKSDCDQNEEHINDNISEKANSVQTSYRYKKNKNGPNSTSSKGPQENNKFQHYPQNEYETSVEMSDNDNLICPNCINCTLMEQKRERNNLNNLRDRDYGFENTNALIDKNREYDRDLIDEKRRQRERNQNDAYQNLAKINAGLSNKEKLIQQNENSRNPLNEGLPDYQYQKFQDEYNRRQKMINDNINKYYPNINNERPEISSYYDNYVNNPNFESSRKKYNNNSYEKDRQRNYDDYDNKERNRREYIKALEDQINYKNELKRREKEEERKRGQRQYEEIQRELKREEEERYLKEQRKKEEYKIANLELMNQKKDRKIKELQEQLKYREMVDKQNEDYQREKERQQIEKERMKDDIYNQNKNDYINRQKMKELERERDRQYNDDMYINDNQGFDPRKKHDKYDKRFDNTGYKGKNMNEFGEYDSPEYINKNKKYQDRYNQKGEKDKYDQYDAGRKGNKFGENNYDDNDRNINQYEGKGFDSKYGHGFGPKYDKYGNKIYDDKGNQYKDKYGKLGDNDEGKYEYRYDKNGQMKVKERMGRCCRCHGIFPRRLLSINRYFYKENRI